MRFINLEMDTRSQNAAAVAITAANYKIKYKGSMDQAGRNTDVFEVHPRKKRDRYCSRARCGWTRKAGLAVHQAGQMG